MLAGGMIIFGNYRKMRDMESVIASLLCRIGPDTGQKNSGELEVESVPGEVYPDTGRHCDRSGRRKW